MPHTNKGKRHHCLLDSGRAGNCRYTSFPGVPRHCGKHQVACEKHAWIWTKKCDPGCVVCLVAAKTSGTESGASSGTESSASSEDGEAGEADGPGEDGEATEADGPGDDVEVGAPGGDSDAGGVGEYGEAGRAVERVGRPKKKKRGKQPRGGRH